MTLAGSYLDRPRSTPFRRYVDNPKPKGNSGS